ncbi:MAG: hypothetical protein ACRCXT_21380 [Paraclostridium sp.]
MIIKRIFSRDKAMELISMGNTLVRMEADKKDLRVTIFIFEKNPKLLADMDILNARINK